MPDLDRLTERIEGVIDHYGLRWVPPIEHDKTRMCREIAELLDDYIAPGLDEIVIRLPKGIVIGDLHTVSGVLLDASTNFIDWEQLREGDENLAIDAVGRLLLTLAHELRARGKAVEG